MNTYKFFRRIPAIWRLVISLLIGIMFIVPLVLVTLSSFKSPAEASQSPPALVPSRLTIQNFSELRVGGAGIGRYLLNTSIVTLGAIAVTLVVGTLAAYAFRRHRFPGSNIVFVALLTPVLIPFQVILPPLYLVMRTIGLANSLLGLIVLYATYQLPFTMFVMRVSLQAIPGEIFESAEVDGVTTIGMLTRMVPLLVPGLITAGLFAFFMAWNEFIAALILLAEQTKFTLPIMLTTLVVMQQGAINWGLLQAGVVITIAPATVVFLILQRYFAAGLIEGSGK